jgi:autotransporter-associated beta strand protein
MSSYWARLARGVAIGALLSSVMIAPAAAATRSWVGGPGDSWSDPANWNPAVQPADGDDLVFDASGSSSSVNDLNLSLKTISLGGVTHSVTGAPFTLTEGITVNGPGSLTLVDVTLGGNQTWSSPSGTINVDSVALNGHTWTVDAQQAISVRSVSGTGVINKGGSGTLLLSQDSTFSGPVTVATGTLEIRTAQGLGVSDGTAGNGTTIAAGATLFVNPVGALTLDDEAMTLSGTGVGGVGALVAATSNPVTFTGPITLAATAAIDAGNGSSRTMIFEGPIKGPGDLVINGDTVAVLEAIGTNTVPAIGFANVGAAVLRASAPMALASARINVPAGAMVVLDDPTDVLGLDGAGMVTLGTSHLTVRNTLASTFTGTITGSAGSLLIKDGAGMLTLGGANSYALGPRIDAGTLRITHGNALGLADGTDATATIVGGGATLALDNVNLTIERIRVGGAAQPAILQVMGTNPSNINGPVVMTQMAAITGTHGAELRFNAESMIATPVSITNANLVVAHGNTTIQEAATVNAGARLTAGENGLFGMSADVVLNGGTFALEGRQITVRSLSGNGVLAFGTNGWLLTSNTTDATFAGTSTGTGMLTKGGAGALTLSGALAVSGGVTINGGTLILAHAQALAATPKITILYGAALAYTVGATPAYPIELNGGGPAGDGTVQVLGGDVTFTGELDTSSGFESLVRVSAPYTVTFNGPVDAPVLSIVGSGTAVFASTGNPLDALYIGKTPVTNAVVGPTTVRFANANALGAPFQLQVAAGSTFDLNGFDQTVVSMTGEGTVAIGARTLTIEGGSLFEGSLTGTGAIVALPDQGLQFSGTSTFTGTVTAAAISNAGTLPATLHATNDRLILYPNSVSGPVSVADVPNIFVLVGDEPSATGVMVGGLDLPASAFMSAYVHNEAMMTVNGAVKLAGALTPFLHPTISVPAESITLIDNDGTDPIVGTFAGHAEGTIMQVGDVNYRITYVGGTGNDVTLTKIFTTYYLSEGATGAFFDTDLLIANPNQQTVDVTVEFYREDGELEGFLYHIEPLRRITIHVDELEGLESATFSTIVRSADAMPVIVERTMRWDATGYGAHTEKATSGPALTWYFAEGSEGFFRTYLLLANPDFQPNTATVTYLREGESSIVRTYDLPANSRYTVQAADDPELRGRSFGMTVTFARRGIAERAMYFGESPIWKGGHESLGETATSTTWFLAEGATGAGFDTFILVANPNQEPADVTYTFLSELAAPATITKTIPGLSRLTVNIEAEGLSIPDGPVATQVSATRPVIAERAQYWPLSFDAWTETHNSFGVTSPGLKWGLAEGRAGGPESYQTYILVANAGMEPAHVVIEFLGDGESDTPGTVTIDVPAQRRINVPVVGFGTPEDPATTFGAVIFADKPIVVERAMYWNVNGEVWAAGTNATATRLQ